MKKAIAAVVLYTAVMAAGLFWVKTAKGVGYSDPGFIEHFFWILLGLAAATVCYALVLRRSTAIPFTAERRWGAYLLVMAPIVVALAIAGVVMLRPTWAFLAPIIATLFVGIGEEIAFRQVLFGALLTRSAERGGTLARPILVSSLAFSALHIVNVLGGQTPAQVGVQLVLTFLAGLLFAGLYLQTKSLLAMIAFHWLWDALTFMGAERQIPWMLFVMPTLVVMQIVIGLILLRKYWRMPARDLLTRVEQPLAAA